MVELQARLCLQSCRITAEFKLQNYLVFILQAESHVINDLN